MNWIKRMLGFPSDEEVSATAASRKYANTTRVLRAIDGDTVDIVVRVRIAGIRAPEMDEAGGEEARRALTAMLPTSTKCDAWWAVGRAQYGRLEAQITNETFGNVGLEMYRRGLVEMDEEYKKIYGIE